MIKFPLKVVAKIVHTTSKVESAKISVVDSNNVELKSYYGDLTTIQRKVNEAHEYIAYVEKLNQELKKLVENKIIDAIV